MDITYDVHIWKIEVYSGQRGKTYRVRWSAAGQRHKETFKSRALADSFRAELLAAARKGEGFAVETGRPVSMHRNDADLDWYEFACSFMDMRWRRSAATTRRTDAEVLTAITALMLTTDKGRPEGAELRRSLERWGFNTMRRDQAPPEVQQVLRWVNRHSRPVSALRKPEVLRAVLDGLALRLDGAHAAPTVVNRRKQVLNTTLEYAVERRILPGNPMPALKWRPPKGTQTVDRRCVANPVQARTLLNAIREQQRTGPRLVAFFGTLYFAALRPEEAVGLAKRHLALPERGWGELHLDQATPHAGKDWTDSGKNRDDRQLKHRAVGESRTVPCPPELTALLNEHVRAFGTSPEGRLFTGERNQDELPKVTILKAWRRARAKVFTPEVAASPLARRPYDLRHAAVSTWLNGGVPPTDVAEWAGHSVDVLLKIYAGCLDGSAEQLRQRVQAALGHLPSG